MQTPAHSNAPHIKSWQDKLTLLGSKLASALNGILKMQGLPKGVRCCHFEHASVSPETPDYAKDYETLLLHGCLT